MQAAVPEPAGRRHEAAVTVGARVLIICESILFPFSIARSSPLPQILSFLWRGDLPVESVWGLMDVPTMHDLWAALLRLPVSTPSLSCATLFTLQHQHLPPRLLDPELESTLAGVSSLIGGESSDEMVLLCLQVCRHLISQCSDATKSSPSLIVKALDLFRAGLAKSSPALHGESLQLMQSFSAKTIALALPKDEREFQVAQIMIRLK